MEVGLVDGVRAATTPTGQPISTTRRASSRRNTPQLGTSLIDAHTSRLANSFFSRLWSATP